MTYQVGILDDHQLFSKSLALMLESFPNFTVTLDVTSGAELQWRLGQMRRPPDIILLDVNMPQMNGVDCAYWLAKHYPAIKVAALTINDTDMAVMAMLKAGCCSYLLKNTHPNDLEKALLAIAKKGYYNVNRAINFKKLIGSKDNPLRLTELERKFLHYACSDITYDQIALLIGQPLWKIEKLRVIIFAKLNVQSRTGMAMEALRRGLVEL